MNMELDYTEVVVSAIGLLGVLISAWYGYRTKYRGEEQESHRADQAENEMKFQRAALSFAAYLEEWAVIESDARYLLENTNVDRFMILRAWNGARDPKWTTSVYQMRMEGQEPIQYVHFELDADYQSRLREISDRRFMTFAVDEIPESFIKRIYQAEGVKHSSWFLIDEHELEREDGNKAKAITYCSFATHGDEPLTPDELTRCQILVGRLKACSASFDK